MPVAPVMMTFMRGRAARAAHVDKRVMVTCRSRFRRSLRRPAATIAKKAAFDARNEVLVLSLFLALAATIENSGIARPRSRTLLREDRGRAGSRFCSGSAPFARRALRPQLSFSSSPRSVACSALLKRPSRSPNAVDKRARPRAMTLRPAGVTIRRWRRRSAVSISRRTKP